MFPHLCYSDLFFMHYVTFQESIASLVQDCVVCFQICITRPRLHRWLCFIFSSTKCELAKVMNRQSSYQELLAQRDDAIKFLEGRLDTSGSVESQKLFNNIKNGYASYSFKLLDRILYNDHFEH